MRETQCLKVLMDPSYPIEQKTEELAEYIRWSKAVGKTMGLGVCYSVPSALRQLYEALPEEDGKAQSELEQTLDAIHEYSKHMKAKKSAKKKKLAEGLRSLAPRTPVKIRDRNWIRTVTFLELKRTRFIFEDTDGRRFSTSIEAFVGVADSKDLKLLPEDVRQKRNLVGALVGRSSAHARTEILNSGIEIFEYLLDELNAAIRRIEEAPSGLSGGVFRNSLGIIKKVNPLDKALVKRIPEVVGELAERIGTEKVQKELERYPDTEAKEYLMKTIMKPK